jgi:large subunit ribosomal protein L24
MTQSSFKVKRGDLVQVMVGKHKGRRATVERVLLSDSRVVLEGVGEVRRHIRPSQANPNGFVIRKVPIHISNVSLVDPSTNKPGRIGFRSENGEKIRFFKKTQTILQRNHVASK